MDAEQDCGLIWRNTSEQSGGSRGDALNALEVRRPGHGFCSLVTELHRKGRGNVSCPSIEDRTGARGGAPVNRVQKEPRWYLSSAGKKRSRPSYVVVSGEK